MILSLEKAMRPNMLRGSSLLGRGGEGAQTTENVEKLVHVGVDQLKGRILGTGKRFGCGRNIGGTL